MRIYEDKDARMKKLISLSRVNIMLFGGYNNFIVFCTRNCDEVFERGKKAFQLENRMRLSVSCTCHGSKWG